MKFMSTMAVCLPFLTVSTAALATTVTFSEPQLTNGAVTAGGVAALNGDTVTVVSSGLTLTATTADGNLRTYDNVSPTNGSGLYIGAITGGGFNPSNMTAPTSATYALNFDQAVTDISFTFDWLTNRGNQPEKLSTFLVDGAPAMIGYTDLGGTSYTSATQTILSTSRTGEGTVTYSGGPFTSLSFLHEQTANNIGFVISNVTVDVAAVPLPASLPLLLLGFGSIAALRRKRRT